MKNLKVGVSVIILLFINFIFLYKYSIRHTEYGFFVSILLLIIQFGVFFFRNKIPLSIKFQKVLCYFLFAFIIGIVILSHFAIPVESLNVDRWSVISSFLTEVFKGEYPYYAKSHMDNYPGPMPIYFLIASPFYLMGELSLLSSLGYILMLYLIFKNLKLNRTSTFLIFYILTSLFMLWELTTRSNLFSFTILILLTLNAFSNLKIKDTVNFYVLAVLTGLLLSTRSVYILPYIVFFLSSLLNREITFKKLFHFLSIAVLAFALTFIPFIIFFKDDFFTMNPFIIQSSFLVPQFYTFIFIIIALFLSFLVKNYTDKFFYSGLSLFIAIFIYSLYYLVNYGFEQSFFDHKVDISYFIFCIPFFMMYLLKNDNDDKNSVATFR